MKKKSKPMEFPSIRIYEQVVRRIFLNNLSWIAAFLLAGQTVLAETSLTPVFFVFDSENNMFLQAERLETQGARLRQRIPPSVLIVDLPSSLNPSSIPFVKTFYTSAISVSNLDPLGPLAKAAGLQWNRRFLGDSQKVGANSFGAMRVLVAQRSFTPIKNLKTRIEERALRVSWDPQEAALYYEIETAFNLSFSDRYHKTKTNHSEISIPAPGTGKSETLYTRVRPIDHAEAEHRVDQDVFGSWSGAQSSLIPAFNDDKSGTPPSPSSPLNNHQTEGFTLILEWQGSHDGAYRVQLAESDSFSDVLIDEIVHGKEFVVPSQPLHVGDSLYWRVMEWGEKTSPWSEKRRVRIGVPKHTQTDMFIDPEIAK